MGNRQRGFVLAIMLIFLLCIMILITASLKLNSLQYKISAYWQQSQIAFQNAESLLAIAESVITINDSKGEKTEAGLGEFQYKLIKQEPCVTYYEINSIGRYAKITIKLRSILKVNNLALSNCGNTEDFAKQRVFWEQLQN